MLPEEVIVGGALVFMVLFILLSLEIIKRIRLHSLPEINDEEFITTFNKSYPPLLEDIIIRERNYIAHILKIDPYRLSPLYTVEKLYNAYIRFSFFGDVDRLERDYIIVLGVLQKAGIEIEQKNFSPCKYWRINF